jgi:hypothetical protein
VSGMMADIQRCEEQVEATVVRRVNGLFGFPA